LIATARAAIASMLGFGIAAAYLVPFSVHRHFFSLDNYAKLWGANYAYTSQLFHYGPGLFPSQRFSWRVLDWVSVALAVTLLCLVAPIFKNRGSPTSRKLLGFAIVATMLATMLAPFFPHSAVYQSAPQLKEILLNKRNGIFIDTFLTLGFALTCYWLSFRTRTASDRIGLEGKTQAPDELLSDLLAVVALASYFLMTTLSVPIWIHLKFLWGILFPWRFNVLLSVAATGLVALSVPSLRKLSPKWVAAAAACWLLIVGVSAHA